MVCEVGPSSGKQAWRRLRRGPPVTSVTSTRRICLLESRLAPVLPCNVSNFRLPERMVTTSRVLWQVCAPTAHRRSPQSSWRAGTGVSWRPELHLQSRAPGSVADAAGRSVAGPHRAASTCDVLHYWQSSVPLVHSANGLHGRNTRRPSVAEERALCIGRA
jgi:hypothetical protein